MSNRTLSSTEVGRRLRVSREAAGLTQARAASKIGIARTTLVAIEQGVRRARTDEIQRLAQAYSTSVNAILRTESVFVALIPRFRKITGTEDPESLAAAKLLQHLVRAEVELEAILNAPRRFNYPRERPLMRGDVNAQAQHDATELRHWVGLGLAPVRNIASLLELDLGVRLYIRPLTSGISGLFTFEPSIGACILLNANHPRSRRNYTAAHELGHFLSVRGRPSVMRSDQVPKSREERYANAFARAFLMPARTVGQMFQQVTTGATHLTRRHVIVLAHYFKVSREAIVRRMEELQLVRRGTWDWFRRNGGITDQQAQAARSESVGRSEESDESSDLTTSRFHLLAAEAWRRELLSEGQLAQLLHLGRVHLRQILDEAEDDRRMEHGAPKLPG